ncbi:LSM domain-containing protein 1 [Leucoagaricus sp. SymC.cos]|nr:LSM domain-containing protein 1 [Leucoagaricus sp. SymC.cos]
MSSPPVIRLAHPPSPPSAAPHTPAIEKLQSLLRQSIRVSTTDGRIFIGTFSGTDKLLNIILTNTEEYRVQGSDDLPDGRYVSLVMVPWKHVASIEAPARWTEGRSQHQTLSPDTSMYF